MTQSLGRLLRSLLSVLVVLGALFISGCNAMGNVGIQSVIGDLAFSPEGKTLAFREYKTDTTRGIGFLSLTTGERRFIAAPDGYRYTGPSYSPDGRLMTAAFYKTAIQSQIVIMDVDGGNIRELTTGRGCRTSPNFSPDGTRIIFIYSPLPDTKSTKRCVDEDVYEVDVSYGQIKRLTHYEFYQAGSASYMPDGKQFLFYGDGPTAVMKPGDYEEQHGENYIFIMDGLNNEIAPAISGYNYSRNPAISTNGDIVFVARKDSYNYDLFVRSDGRDSRLTNSGAIIAPPAISRDGTKIAFQVDQSRNGTYELMIINADGSGLQSLGISGRLF